MQETEGKLFVLVPHNDGIVEMTCTVMYLLKDNTLGIEDSVLPHRVKVCNTKMVVVERHLSNGKAVISKLPQHMCCYIQPKL